MSIPHIRHTPIGFDFLTLKKLIMVKLKFVIRNGVLALRISEGKDRYYKRVVNLLKGNPNIKYWKPDKEMFSGHAEFYKENNKILDGFKEVYWKLVQKHPELSAKQVAEFYKARQHSGSQPVQLADWDVLEYRNSVSKYLEVIIKREKAKQGCNFETYYKLLTRCRRDIPSFDSMAFSTIDYNQMVTIAYIFAREPAYKNISKTFRALLGKASKDPDVDFNISQIGDFKFNDYNPNRYDTDSKHPDILTSEQLRAYLNANPFYLTPNYRNRDEVELYYNFCVFMFYSFFAPCDVIKAKLKDITNRQTIMIRRKKTHRTVEVPISPAMQIIIDKYRGQSKDGYIFPILDDKKERTYKTKDYTFKAFREKINHWLKSVGKSLELDYDLYAYVFRHTAITVAIDNGLPISYVSNVAGTSVEMIQQHYYNGDNVKNRNMLNEAFMNASK